MWVGLERAAKLQRHYPAPTDTIQPSFVRVPLNISRNTLTSSIAKPVGAMTLGTDGSLYGGTWSTIATPAPQWTEEQGNYLWHLSGVIGIDLVSF
jgi:hypothetical protein